MFMEIARVVARRGTCPRLCVGAVVVLDGKHVVAHGYNGAPPKQPHCTDIGCLLSPTGACIRAVHAEVNALEIAESIAYDDAPDHTLYVTHSPCKDCAKTILSHGVEAVYFETPYRSSEGLTILANNGVGIFRVMPNGYIIEGTEGKLLEAD